MILSGYDSAFAPSLTAAQQARAQGATFWFGYGRGPGTYHVWTTGEWAVLRQAALTPGYLWVPTFGLAEDPIQAAQLAVGDATALGLYGAVMLDTEYQMRSSSRLVSFVDGFCAEVHRLGRAPVVYDGAHYVPPGVASFHVNWGGTTYPGSGQADQYGPATRFGMSVDVDLADSAFPLASWTKPQPLPPLPPPAPPRPIPGENVRALSANVRTDENGNGWTDIQVGSSKPIGAAPDVLAAEPGTANGGYDTPRAARTIGGKAGWQRVQVTGGEPNAVYGVELVVSP